LRFPRLFQSSAYPELDKELEELLANYAGTKVMVVVHVRILHLSFPSEAFVMYLFSKKTDEVRGIKHSGTPATVGESVDFGKTIADFYSRQGGLQVVRLEHQFISDTQWPG
jgi:hypothetical protein